MARILLVVPNDPLTLALAGAILGGAGHEIISSDSVGQFYMLMDKHLPHLMVLDIHLPGSEAYILLQKVRKHPEYGRIPVLFLAGRNSIQDRLTGFRHGADAYLVKPFQPEHLMDRVENLNRHALPDGTGIRGLFELYPFLDLLQIFGRRKRTGTLFLGDGEKPLGSVIFKKGLVHSARYGPLMGDDAFLDLLDIDRGRFGFTEGNGRDPDPRTIRQTDLQILLLESAWLRKETTRHSGNLDLGRRPWWAIAIDYPSPPIRLEKLPIRIILDDLTEHPGSFLGEIASRSGKSKGRVAVVLSWLWSLGMVSSSDPAEDT